MMALIIVIILACLAVPGFINFIQQIRLSAIVGELHSAISLTRTEAIKHNGKADLVAVDGNWKNGWVIKNQFNELLLTHAPLHKAFHVSGKFSDGEQHIAYNSTGHARTAKNSNASQSGHIQISLGDNTRLIVVNFSGKVRVCNPASDKKCTINAAEY